MVHFHSEMVTLAIQSNLNNFSKKVNQYKGKNLEGGIFAGENV